MKIYLDTSSLFKLYYVENDSIILERFLLENNIVTIFLSEISKIEFYSTVWKKVRNKEFEFEDSEKIKHLFENSLKNYIFVPVEKNILTRAKILVNKYGQEGLRTLDSIQLSCCLEIKNETDKYFTADKLLLNIFEKENLPT